MVKGAGRTLPTALCALALLAGAASLRAAESFAVEVATGNFDERCLKIATGQVIRWCFTASGAVDFNIHRHRGSEAFYPVRRDNVERASGSFRTGVTEDCCLMWTKKGSAAVIVRGGVEREP